MPDLSRIATCNYCGTRSVLELTGASRHQLTCPACGAQLSEMKRLKTEHPGKPQRAKAPPHPAPLPARDPRPQYDSRHRPRRPKKSSFKRKAGRIFDELFDVIEDIFD